jgi:hypothetical protein
MKKKAEEEMFLLHLANVVAAASAKQNQPTPSTLRNIRSAPASSAGGAVA